MRKERIIFDNYDVDEKDWEEVFKEREEEDEITMTDEQKWEYIWDDIQAWYDDEVGNLDLQLDNKILVIADLGLWNGRRSGYKIIGSNLNGIMATDCDYLKVYSDGYNIKCDCSHHDGNNYYEYRLIKDEDNIDKLLDKLYDDEPVTRAMINRYTKSLLPYVKKIYGW